MGRSENAYRLWSTKWLYKTLLFRMLMRPPERLAFEGGFVPGEADCDKCSIRAKRLYNIRLLNKG